MKNLLLASAAAIQLIASPAAAQSYDPSVGTGNLNSTPYAHTQAPAVQLRLARPDAARGAYARVPARGAYARVPGGPPVITESGRGGFNTDPDPNIRFQLNRESEQGEW